jgi:hypothetical protein
MSDVHSPTPNGFADENSAEPGSVHVSDEAVRRLAEAVTQLGNDPDFFVQSLTDFLLAMKPISKDRLTDNEVRFLVESGDFTANEWAETAAAVDRGSLQLRATEGWLLDLFATKSMEDVAGFLDWRKENVRSAVSDGNLYAVEISGRLRFPAWQFGVPGKLLPGLPELIAVMAPRWQPQSVAGFMSTPQCSLVSEGRKTPAQWLRDGGDVTEVIRIVEKSDWS